MKITSVQILKEEYFKRKPLILAKYHVSKKIKAGSIVNFTQTCFAAGQDFAPFLRGEILKHLREEYVSRNKAVLLSKNSRSVKVVGNFRGFLFFKTLILRSPTFLGITPAGTKRILQSFRERNNIKSLLFSKHSFFKKLKKLK